MLITFVPVVLPCFICLLHESINDSPFAHVLCDVFFVVLLALILVAKVMHLKYVIHQAETEHKKKHDGPPSEVDGHEGEADEDEDFTTLPNYELIVSENLDILFERC